VQFNFTEMWQHMGIPALVVAGILLMMGMASLTVFMERFVTLQRSKAASRVFVKTIGTKAEAGQFDAILAESERHKHSHLARVIHACLSTFRRALHTPDMSGLTPFDRTQLYMERFMEQTGTELRRGLSVLASVGSVAPFVGLLGTVLGIISAFQGIAATGSGGLSSVSAGISEALIETALGLSVAIPAVLAFNYLSTQIAREEIGLQHASSHMLESWAERLGGSSIAAPVVAPHPTVNRVAPLRVADNEALA
jgi:biopolymer transport protein ExbB